MSFDDLKFNLKPFDERAKVYTPELDTSLKDKLIPLGISYIDRMTHGLMPDDFMLVGSYTGSGKTELVSIFADSAASKGKRVTLLALEATEGEIEQRSKFRLYSEFISKDFPQAMKHFTFRDFQLGLMADYLPDYKERVEKEIEKRKNLSIFYRGRDFGIKQFEQVFNSLEGKADLVIIDHLHYFDTEDENEQRALSQIMKKIRDLNQIAGIPVILVAHLRKKDRGNVSIVPGEAEFMGTSNISKIPTIILTLSAGEALNDNRFETFFRIAKCRGDGRVTRFVGKGTFNANINSYEKEFILGTLKKNESEFQMIERPFYPEWYVRRI